VRDGERGFRRNVAQRRAGAAGGENERTLHDIGQLDQRCLDLGLLVGDQAADELHRVGSTSPNQVSRAGSPLFR